MLLPKIFALWSELFVPLVYRSRFFLNPQMPNYPFFCEMEFRWGGGGREEEEGRKRAGFDRNRGAVLSWEGRMACFRSRNGTHRPSQLAGVDTSLS